MSACEREGWLLCWKQSLRAVVIKDVSAHGDGNTDT